jgi:hypothetical protein
MCSASMLNRKKRDGGFAQTVAIHLLYAYTHRSTQQCRHPKPNKRYFYAGDHFGKIKHAKIKPLG